MIESGFDCVYTESPCQLLIYTDACHVLTLGPALANA